MLLVSRSLRLIIFMYQKLGRAMRKLVFGHMQTAKTQIRRRIRAVWSGPLLSADGTIWDYRMNQWRASARMRLRMRDNECAVCAASKALFCLVWPSYILGTCHQYFTDASYDCILKLHTKIDPVSNWTNCSFDHFTNRHALKGGNYQFFSTLLEKGLL